MEVRRKQMVSVRGSGLFFPAELGQGPHAALVALLPGVGL